MNEEIINSFFSFKKIIIVFENNIIETFLFWVVFWFKLKCNRVLSELDPITFY